METRLLSAKIMVAAPCLPPDCKKSGGKILGPALRDVKSAGAREENGMIKVAVDAMGGDNAPGEIV